jgi:hypothetical protein
LFVPDLMLLARVDGDGDTGLDLECLVIHLHLSSTGLKVEC